MIYMYLLNKCVIFVESTKMHVQLVKIQNGT